MSVAIEMTSKQSFYAWCPDCGWRSPTRKVEYDIYERAKRHDRTCPHSNPVSEALDRSCPHENFDAIVAVVRVTETEGGPVNGFMAEIRVRCVDCDEPFRWSGVRAGISHSEPRCSVDEMELRAPLRPASADPDFGMGISGFSVTLRQPGERVDDRGRDYGPARR